MTDLQRSLLLAIARYVHVANLLIVHTWPLAVPGPWLLAEPQFCTGVCLPKSSELDLPPEIVGLASEYTFGIAGELLKLTVA